MATVSNYRAPLLLPILNLLVVLAVGASLLVVVYGNRLETRKSAKVLEYTARSSIQVNCFAEVYFLNPVPDLTSEQRVEAVAECVRHDLAAIRDK